MEITSSQMLMVRNQIGPNQFAVVGDFEGSIPQMVGRIEEATSEQIGRAFGSMIAMMEFYFIQARNKMRDNQAAVEQLEAYFEDARKRGYSPQ